MRSTSTTPTPASTRARSRSWYPSATCAPSRPTPSRSRRRPGSRSRPGIPRKAASTTCAAPRRAMNAGRRSRGFTLVGMLLAVAALGGGLAAYGELTSHAAQREKERELLFAGNQIRQAIGAYYERSPGGARRFPQKLEDLRKTPGAAGTALVIGADRLADLVAGEEQLPLLLALRGVRGQLAVGGEAAAERCDREQHADQREAAAAPTSVHSPSRGCARRRRRLSWDPRAGPRPRSSATA